MSMSIDEKRAQYTKLSKYINTPNKFRNKLMKAISKGYPINYAHPYTGETLLNNLLMYQGTEYTHDRLIEDKQDQKKTCEDTAEIADSFGIALQEIAEGGKTKHDPAQRYGYFFDYIFHCQNLT